MRKVGADATGRTGLDWGIYGVPETFVSTADGTILLRFPGPLSPDVVEDAHPAGDREGARRVVSVSAGWRGALRRRRRGRAPG